MRAVLSIGSNMSERLRLLNTVFTEFHDDIVAASSVYATPPWGVTDQADFLNAVLIVDVDQSSLELLHRGQRLEDAADRVRVRHWGPRTLDVDIVQAWREPAAREAGTARKSEAEIRSNQKELTLPHPYAHDRAFVLVPWLEADPAAQLNGRGIKEYLDKLDSSEVAGVRRLGRIDELLAAEGFGGPQFRGSRLPDPRSGTPEKDGEDS